MTFDNLNLCLTSDAHLIVPVGEGQGLENIAGSAGCSGMLIFNGGMGFIRLGGLGNLVGAF